MPSLSSFLALGFSSYHSFFFDPRRKQFTGAPQKEIPAWSLETPAQAPLSVFPYGEIQEATRHRDMADMEVVITAVMAVEVATVAEVTAAEAEEVIENWMAPLFS